MSLVSLGVFTVRVGRVEEVLVRCESDSSTGTSLNSHPKVDKDQK